LNRLGRYRAQSIADALADFDIDPDRTRVLATRVTADARAPSLPPQPGAEQLPASGVSVPSLADDTVGREQQDDLALDFPELIAVPLELQALAKLEAEAGLAANVDDAAAEKGSSGSAKFGGEAEGFGATRVQGGSKRRPNAGAARLYSAAARSMIKTKGKQ